MRNLVMILGCVLSAMAPTSGQDNWQLADANVKRLPPSAFANLPKDIVKYLQARHCTIPQLWAGWQEKSPHNVIRGQFRKRGRYDWAVLCSRNRVSSILVFWNSSTRRPAEINNIMDEGFLQVVEGDGEIGFSRSISVADKKYILEHYKAYGGPKPPPITHEGIDDGFMEKASEILYYYRGRWFRLQGAD